MIIDATDLKVGRIATVAAKLALRGEKVDIINVEKAIITGRKDVIVKKYRDQYERGRYTKGPFQPRMADRFVRRIIRSMLPYKNPRGKEALQRVMCHIGNPLGKEGETIKEAHISNSTTMKFVTVKEVCQLLGGRQ